MKVDIKLRSLIFVLFLSSLSLPSQQHALVVEQVKRFPESASYNYEFIDLGATDLPLELLNHYALPVSYAPQINDQRQVTCNQMGFGEIKGATQDFMRPQISYLKSNCYALNNCGDVLLGFDRTYGDMDWLIWTQKNFNKINSRRIDLGDLLGQDLHLRVINDSSLAVGVFKPAGVLRPILWSPEDGLHHLGFYLGWDITGVIWDVNNSGTVVGFIEENGLNTPFVWNKACGLNRLNHLKSLWKSCTCVPLDSDPQFMDLVINENSVVYGTFKEFNDDPKTAYKAFWWDPYSGTLRKLDLDGMRINAIGPSDILVGSWNGQAALSDPGNTPVLLSGLIKDLNSEWKLLEATDINTHGDIVGYGIYQNKPHFFMLKKGCIKPPAKPAITPEVPAAEAPAPAPMPAPIPEIAPTLQAPALLPPTNN